MPPHPDGQGPAFPRVHSPSSPSQDSDQTAIGRVGEVELSARRRRTAAAGPAANNGRYVRQSDTYADLHYQHPTMLWAAVPVRYTFLTRSGCQPAAMPLNKMFVPLSARSTVMSPATPTKMQRVTTASN